MDLSRKSLVKKLWQQPSRMGTCFSGAGCWGWKKETDVRDYRRSLCRSGFSYKNLNNRTQKN